MRTDPEVLQSIPGYSLRTEDLARQYTQELEEAFRAGTVTDFIDKWKSVWLLDAEDKPDAVRNIDLDIVNRRFSFEEALECLAGSFLKNEDGSPVEKPACSHQEHGPCHGMEIRMPYGITVGILVGAHFGVPVGTALHQAFCSGPCDSCY